MKNDINIPCFLLTFEMVAQNRVWLRNLEDPGKIVNALSELEKLWSYLDILKLSGRFLEVDGLPEEFVLEIENLAEKQRDLVEEKLKGLKVNSIVEDGRVILKLPKKLDGDTLLSLLEVLDYLMESKGLRRERDSNGKRVYELKGKGEVLEITDPKLRNELEIKISKEFIRSLDKEDLYFIFQLFTAF